jgi:hypothetical protein
MLFRIVRNLSLEEVQKRIEEFEKRQGMKFEKFEELLLKRKINPYLMSEYVEWAELVHAYHGYIESGELDYVIEELRELNPLEASFLTPKRLELLYNLANLHVESINDLAQKTRRNVKNVYQDLLVLKKLGFVTFKKKGKRNIVPETPIKELTLLIR